MEPSLVNVCITLVFLVVTALPVARTDSLAKSPTSYEASVPAAVDPSWPRILTFEIVKSFPHDTSAFTEGLVYLSHNASGGRSTGEGIFYESTGMRGQSTVREVDVATGKVLKKVAQSPQVFSEGLTLVNNNRLLQLAWQVQTGSIYSRQTLQKIGSFRHQMTDGWGLSTYNRSLLVGSDGTSYIYFISATSFKTLHKVQVTDGGTPIAWINELEVRGNRIYANVWQTDCVAVIDPVSGRVAAWMDLQRLRGLAAARVKPRQEFDVLNGIAWDAQQRRLFVTGKYWPLVFQIAPKTRPASGSRAADLAAIRERCHPQVYRR
ncbi:hypothetical protein CLOP_g12941 [Closterium sp. NIES-67]|nr:hypothetical protein CLOP_g12941 [Closterium sp. NIES-67]